MKAPQSRALQGVPHYEHEEFHSFRYIVVLFCCTAIYPPPPPPPKKKWHVFKRAYRRNNERSCVLFFKILLEYQFFTEMLKQVRGSVNEYVDTLVYRRAILFRWGRRGGYIVVLYGISLWTSVYLYHRVGG